MSIWIVCAAIKDIKTGLIFSLSRPNRHHNILHLMYDIKVSNGFGDVVQGFLSTHGDFYNREDAAKIALNNHQIEKLMSPPDLYSEDLW